MIREPGLIARLAAAMFGGLALLAWSGAAADEQSTVVGYARWAEQAVADPPDGLRFQDELARRLIVLAAERRRALLPEAPALVPDPGLRLSARAHALDMLARGYLDHAGPDGRDVKARVAILDRRFIGLVGENLAEHVGIEVAEPDPQLDLLAAEIAKGWFDSPGHRDNLLNPDYSHFGLAAASRGGRVVIVHVLGMQIAELDQPLPLEVERYARLPLELTVDGAGPPPEKYAFAPPGEHGVELVLLDLAADQVVVDPGTYQLKFFTPTDDGARFQLADGPIVVVEQVPVAPGPP